MAGLLGIGGAGNITPPTTQPVVKMADPKDPVQREEDRKKRERQMAAEGGGREETRLASAQPPSYSNKNLGA